MGSLSDGSRPSQGHWLPGKISFVARQRPGLRLCHNFPPSDVPSSNGRTRVIAQPNSMSSVLWAAVSPQGRAIKDQAQKNPHLGVICRDSAKRTQGERGLKEMDYVIAMDGAAHLCR